jgi:hypothetical protein
VQKPDLLHRMSDVVKRQFTPSDETLAKVKRMI